VHRQGVKEVLMIGTIVAIAVGIGVLFSHWKARQYTRSRLRFVEVVQSPLAPIIAGIGTAIVLAPVVWLLPFVGAPTALLFGVGVGTGVMLGAKDVKRLPSG
jgi:hypothetical protein